MGRDLRIAVIDKNPLRAAILEDGLRAAGHTGIVRIDDTAELLDRIHAIDPDVVLIDLESPSRDILEQMFMVSRSVARPVAMFVDQSDSSDDRRRDRCRCLRLFAACFAVWTIFSIIGIGIKGELGLNETEFGLLIATPILTGALIRMPLGLWSDRYGGRLVFVTVMLASASAAYLLTLAHTYPLMLLAALGLGMAGGSFAVGISYVSRWYPKEKQGTALGIFGVGNVGAAVTTFSLPRL